MPWKPLYATVAEFKSLVRVTDTTDDVEFALVLEAASRAVDQATNRQFGQVTPVEQRFYDAHFDGRRRRWVIEVDDIEDVTGLLVDLDLGNDETYSTNVTDFRTHPFNNDEKGRPFERIILGRDETANKCEGVARVAALWGWTAVPDTIKEATLLQANRFNERRSAPFGVAGSPEIGSEVRLLAKADPDVKVMLANFKRWWAAV